MGFQKKIRELKSDINEVRGDVNSVARTGFRALGKGEVFPLPISDPQASYFWEVAFFGDSKIFRNIKFYARETALPQSSVEMIEENWMGRKIYHSGKDNAPHTLQMTFWDNENLEVYRFLQEWHDLINEPRYGLQVNKQLYTKTIKLALKDASDLFVTGDFWFTMAFPSEISEISLNYENSGPVEVSVTFMFDHKYAGKQKENVGGDSISDYLDLGSYTGAFTGDLQDFDGNSFNNIKEFF